MPEDYGIRRQVLGQVRLIAAVFEWIEDAIQDLVFALQKALILLRDREGLSNLYQGSLRSVTLHGFAGCILDTNKNWL